jgi:predicted cation transporter
MLEISLIGIVLLVLVLPVAFHAVERNLELFLLAMGALSVTFLHFWGDSPVWSLHLLKEAAVEPVMITAAVVVAGLLVFFFKRAITSIIVKAERTLGSKLFCFVLVTFLGAVSSVITAIIAAIILVEVVSALKLDKTYETKLVILGCFSIGLGAALTPLGEPLSTICIAKLRGEPYHADFFFLLRNLGVYIIPGILAVGIIGAIIEPSVREGAGKASLADKESESISDIFVCAGKVYMFVVALIFLGTGFKPIVDTYIIRLSGTSLYWINALSAVMDNATLTAAEISPRMTLGQIQYILMGLLIAGGMLIPGNIPNIIAAGRLKIGSKDWARTGLPLGLAIMIVYYIVFTLKGV